MIPNFEMHRIIRRAVTKRPDFMLDDARLLWERFAVELIPIIGEGGFESLYTRSLLLTCESFPWLQPSHVDTHAAVHAFVPFGGLTDTLKKHDPIEAAEAIITLLIVFTDILAKLIGTALTSKILGSAWGDDALEFSGTE